MTGHVAPDLIGLLFPVTACMNCRATLAVL